MRILIVVDMQNDFIDGALGTGEAVAIVENVKSKIEKCRANGDTVIFTRDTHFDNYSETQEGRNLPVAHCILGSHGWQISDRLPVGNAKIFDKYTFGSIKLAEYIAILPDVQEIELVGLCTDICVISNALLLKAAMPEVSICVDAACCAGVTPESHNNALEAMKMCQIRID